ncbi:RNA polymerase B [Thecaphora frezii]
MASTATARRLRRGMVDDEDAGMGKLGPEFQDAGCLLISEVQLFFARPNDGNVEVASKDDGATAVAQKTKDYVEEFSRYKDPNTIREIRAILIKHAAKGEDEKEYDEEGNPIDDDTGLQLTQFEMAQLANLCITEVDEAKSLIPTLGPKDDALLDSLLQELDNVRRFS